MDQSDNSSLEFVPPNSHLLERIKAADIKVGMYMAYPDRPWLETRFVFQGILLSTQQQVSEVRGECSHIWVDRERSRTIQTAREPVPTDGVAKPVLKSVEKEFSAAQSAHSDAKEQIELNLKSMALGEGISATKIRKSVSSCVTSIVNNPNAMLWLGRLRSKDNYVAEHCLNVGVLAIAFGRHLGLAQEELETLGMCGMLHDIGKIKISREILEKPGKLSDEEWVVMRNHCDLGKRILEQDPDMSKAAIEAAFGHHERFDGTGYPRAVRSDSLSLYTRIISIVDTYDAITTNRSYDRSRPPTEAMKVLFACRETQFEPVLVEKFIECLGIYPTGSLVELRSRETAVVIDTNRDSRLFPKVSILLDEEKHHRTPLIVDTGLETSKTAERTIKRVVDDNDFDIDMRRVFNYFREQSEKTI